MAWNGSGATDPTNRVIDGVRETTGSVVISVSTTAVNTQVTFPTEFGGATRVFCTLIDVAAPAGAAVIRWGSVSGGTAGDGTTTSFWVQAIRSSGTANIRINWIAIGAA